MADKLYPRDYRSDPGGRGPGGEPADPLTELARLIGQSDPFATDSRGVPPRPQQSAEPDWRQATYDERPPAPTRYSQESDYDRDTGYRADDSRSSGHFDPGYADARGGSPFPAEGSYDSRPAAHPDYFDQSGGAPPPFITSSRSPRFDRFADSVDRDQEPDREPYDELDDREPAPKRRGLKMTALAVIGVVLAGTAAAVTYRSVFKSAPGAPPVIRAADTPNKIIPSSQAADGNKAFADRLGPDRGQNEKVVSREEQPVDLSRAIASAQATAAAAPPPPPAALALAPAAPGAPVPPQPTEPRKIRTIPIRADQGSPPRPGAPGTRPAVPSPTSGTAPTSGGPLSLSPQGAPPDPPPRPQAQPRLASVPPAAASGGSGYFVQLSAQKSEAEAQTAYRVAQSKYAAVLAGKPLVIRRKDLGAKGVFYGAQVGPFGKDEADRLCGSLKAAGGSCMIQRN